MSVFAFLGLQLAFILGAQSQPNVVIIMTDDQGWGDFGHHGNPVLETPALDQLARQSARLTEFYVHPVCTPTRAALMTGRYPQRTRAFDTWVGRAMLDPAEVTIAELMGEAGWATGIFGKWHLGDCYPMRAMDQGFDEALVIRGGGIGQPADPEGGEGKYTDPVLFHNGKRVESKGYCTDVYFDAGIKWMRQQHAAKKPFFMYLPTNAPHGPFHDVPMDLYQKYLDKDLAAAFVQPDIGHALPEKFDRDKLARIFAMIENVDQNVAKLDKVLNELEIAENTIVIFMDDNGPNTRRAVGGRLGMKASVFEGGVRSPLWVRWPAKLAAKDVAGTVGANIDVLPTILDACGIEVAAELSLDGRSLLPALTGDGATKARKHPLIIQAHRGDVGVRYHNFLLRTAEWKMVNSSGFGRELASVEPNFKLFNMRTDSLELNDVAAEHPQVIAELQKQYNAWFDDVSTTRPNNYSPPPIIIGHDASPDVTLTRQDWRKLRGAGWSKDSQGQWLVNVIHRGPYEVRIRTLKNTTTDSVELICGEYRRSKSLPASASEVIFHGVQLPLGTQQLRFDLNNLEKTIGPYQVIIRRAKLELNEKGASGEEWVKLDRNINDLLDRQELDLAYAKTFQAMWLALNAVGCAHRDFVSSASYLGSFHYAKERYARAEKVYRWCKRNYVEGLGAESKPVAMMFNNIAISLNYDGRPYQAMDSYQRSLEILRAQDEDCTESIISTLSNMSGLMITLHKYQLAEKYVREALAEYEKWDDKQWDCQAHCYYHLGSCLVVQQKPEEGVLYLEETLKLYRDNVTGDPSRIAYILAHLGTTYKVMGNYDIGLQRLEDALTIYIECRGEDSEMAKETRRNIEQLQKERDAANI